MTAFDLGIQWLVAMIVLIVLVIRGQFTLFHATTFYWIFHVIVFCIRPLLINYLDFDLAWNYMLFTPTPEQMQTTLLLSSYSLVIFCLTYSLSCQMSLTALQGTMHVFSQAEKNAFYLMLLILAPLGFYSIFGANVTGEHVGGVFIMTGSSGYLNDFQQIFVTITVLFVWVNRWKWYAYLPLLLFLGFRLNQGWARWTIIIPLIALLLLYLRDHKRSMPPLRFIIILPILFALFVNLSHDRMYFRKILEGRETESTTVQDSSKDLRDRFDGLDFSNFDFLTYIVAKVPKYSGKFTYGAQHLQLFTEPIPRKIWRGKPIGSPLATFDLNEYGNFLGLTTSIIGDGWISGGWIGVTINMVLAGLALGILFNWFILNQNNIFKVSFFILITSILIQIFRDGSLVTMSKFLLFTTLPIFVWMILTRFIEALHARQILRHDAHTKTYFPAEPSQSLSRP